MELDARGQELELALTRGECKIHLIGVAGSGMSGIAGLLLSLGHSVSGCDRVSTIEVERLQGLGLEFYTPQKAAYVSGAEIVIYSSAIRPGNPAFDAAVAQGLPMYRRAEALAAILKQRQGIVIAGMHGKTTTSSMAAHVLRVGGLKPSHYIGAEIPILGTNAHWDADGSYMVAEGDESDGTLRLYHPKHSVILNIEEEHLDHYRDLQQIEGVFQQLIDQTSGSIFYCADDPVAARLCGGHEQAIGYAIDSAAKYQADRLASSGFQTSFRVLCESQELGTIILNVPGRHNVLNALAVVALATELGVGFDQIASALGTFRAARRRFEEIYRSDNFVVVDDYGHHPSEIVATLTAACGEPGWRLRVIFQPHRYSRTQLLRDKFATAFRGASALTVTGVYAASEKPIEGIGGHTIADAVAGDNQVSEVDYVPLLDNLRTHVGAKLEPGDMLLSLGAGNIHEQARLIARDLELYDAIREAIQHGTIKLYEPMARHTTLRIGGPAQFWVEPETVLGLGNLLRLCAQESLPWMVVGRGSNLLVREGGIAGVVIHLARGEFTDLSIEGDRIHAGAGVKLKHLSLTARDAGIGGFEWFEGIPGTVGGALRMNAGAMGAETFEQVIEVRAMDKQGRIVTVQPGEIEVGYRSVPWFNEHIALAATFSGQAGTPREQIEELLRESMAKRKNSQPAASSAGCIFRNPEGCPAGKLIDEMGLKGLRRGAVHISDVHGNFLVNDGKGTATDVLGLVAEIKREAKQQRGIELVTEVQVVGKPEEVFK